MAADSTIQRAIQDAREGRLDAAIASLRFLVRRQPGNLDALQALAMLLVQSGQTEQALAHLTRAAALAPRVPAYRNNLANALMGLGRHREAAVELRKALEIDPRYELAWLGLAIASTGAGDLAGAIDACERGGALRAGWAALARAHANALEAADRVDDAITVLERAIAGNANDHELRAAHLRMLNYATRPASEVFEAHRAYGASLGGAASAPPAAPRPDGAPLRIGVLSADLRTHSVGSFTEPWIAAIHGSDALRAGVELIAFSANPPNPSDRVETRLRRHFDRWIEAAAMDDATLGRAIRDARLDLLIELSGHTAGSRLGALTPKPAPVIVTATGYPNTTGHPSVDLRIVDSITDPPGSESLATERLLRLDPCFLCYGPPADAPDPALPSGDGPIVFGSFNLSSKISADTVALWSEVLSQVPDAQLLAKSKALAGDLARGHFLARLEAAGIARARVEIVAYTPSIEAHLALYRRVHIALDTVPYNGTTTTCEALWMGVPVVVLEGDRHAARVGASLLAAAGLPEFIARDGTAYARIAADLARDATRLADLRATLRARLSASPLTDRSAYATRLLAALRAAAAG
ncbi:MAG: hypothetical protein RI967_438 [Planctomycetota bacterium]